MTNELVPGGASLAGDAAVRTADLSAAATPGPADEASPAGHQQPASRSVARHPDGRFTPPVPQPPRTSDRLEIRRLLETDPSAARALLLDRLATAEAHCRVLDEVIDRIGALTSHETPRVRKLVNTQAGWSAKVESLLRLLTEMPVPKPDPMAALRRLEEAVMARERGEQS